MSGKGRKLARLRCAIDTACLVGRRVKNREKVLPHILQHRKITECKFQTKLESGAVARRWLSHHMSFPLPHSPCGIFEVLVLDTFYYLVLINLLKPLCLGGSVSCEGDE